MYIEHKKIKNITIPLIKIPHKYFSANKIAIHSVYLKYLINKINPKISTLNPKMQIISKRIVFNNVKPKSSTYILLVYPFISISKASKYTKHIKIKYDINTNTLIIKPVYKYNKNKE